MFNILLAFRRFAERDLEKEAINHRGFALLDILQPCVTFNRVNTYDWYQKRVYHVEPDNDPTFEERIPMIKDRPLVYQAFDVNKIGATLKEFL